MKIFKFLLLLGSLSLISLNFLSCEKCDHNFEIIETKEPTCTKSGYQKFKCTLCDKEKTEPILSDGHNYSEYVIIEEGNCKIDGLKQRECSKCHNIDKVKFQNIVHDFIVESFDATCETDGYTLKTCQRCNESFSEKTTDKFGHSLSSWTISVPATNISDGIEKRMCINCSYFETKIIPSTSYIDLSIIRENLDVTKILTCQTIDELQLLFDTAVLNNASSIEVKIDIPDFDFDNILSILVDNCSVESSYKINASYMDTLTIRFEYKGVASFPASNNNMYTQYSSANYNAYDSKRSNDFDDFKINNSIYSYQVSTSDQLFYVLERGVKPIPEIGSSAEKIYMLAKDVLRNIIDDEMTDFEKIRAIHDYLVLNVTYDGDLLNKTFQNDSNLGKYNGFYLEGVFIDKRAVCEGISKAFSVLCNIEGIPCVQVIGVQTNNPNGVGHAWNKVYLDGKWYVADATSDGIIVNDNFEVLSYQYFLITDEVMSQKYIGNTRENILCDSTYDVYKKLFYHLDNNNFDINIESFDELVSALKYYESLNPKNCSFELKITFDYGSSLIDEIQNAYSILKIYASFSHIINNNILVLIK